MKLGFHISIAGGFKNVVPRAKKCKCATIQLFTRNPRGWKYKPLNKEDVDLFKQALKKENISPIFVHMPYLPNLASSKSDLFRRSVDSVIEDLKRSEFLSAQFLIMHVGSAENKRKGLKQMITGINQVLDKVSNNIILLLENTSGSGNSLGYKFEQIQEIIDHIHQESRIGVVLDTAHAFSAGYNLQTRTGVEKTINEFRKMIGLQKLHLIHLNDSKVKCGSRLDRHWHIGKGEIGRGIGSILNHPLLKNKPFIMETPRKGLKDDLMNLKAVRRYLGKENG
jgi:deoxyribonuclease-4